MDSTFCHTQSHQPTTHKTCFLGLFSFVHLSYLSPTWFYLPIFLHPHLIPSVNYQTLSQLAPSLTYCLLSFSTTPFPTLSETNHHLYYHLYLVSSFLFHILATFPLHAKSWCRLWTLNIDHPFDSTDCAWPTEFFQQSFSAQVETPFLIT